MHKAGIAFALLVMMWLPAAADPIVFNGELSKAQAIARVTVQGFDVRAAQADLAVARARSTTARSELRPHISLAAIATDANLPQLGMPVSRQTYLSASASLPIFNSAYSFGAQAAGITALAAADDLAGVQNDEALAVYRGYDRVLLAAAVADARQADASDQQANVDLISLRVRVGKAARYQLVRARASLAQARQAKEDADAEHDEALTDLKVLLDFDPSSNVQLSDGFTTAPPSSRLATVSARARVQRPELAAAKSRVDAAAASLRQARAAFVPVTSVSAQTYNGTSNPPLGHGGAQISAQVSIPLVDGGARSAAVAQAKADQEKAQAEYDRRSLMVQADVANAWRELTAAQRNLVASQAALMESRENLRVARLRLRAGKAIELEVLDALAVSANAREAALRAQARLDLGIATLHHAAGDPANS
ncbi:MAG: TolC family protein [Candidatus Eremiobacteraeota bacterium]|nr:TolC family protein [Candidatus Eremiobacteraeota bacterium]MBC5808757.1 TolC family protein [Candidatus Eremiobacteraeota bacterium]